MYRHVLCWHPALLIINLLICLLICCRNKCSYQYIDYVTVSWSQLFQIQQIASGVMKCHLYIPHLYLVSLSSSLIVFSLLIQYSHLCTSLSSLIEPISCCFAINCLIKRRQRQLSFTTSGLSLWILSLFHFWSVFLYFCCAFLTIVAILNPS